MGGLKKHRFLSRLYGNFRIPDLFVAVCLLLNAPLLIYTMLSFSEVKTFSGWRDAAVDISASEKLVELMEPGYREAHCYYYAVQTRRGDTLSPFLRVYPSGQEPDWSRAISVDSSGVLNIMTNNKAADIVLSDLSGPIRGVTIKRARSAEEFWSAKGATTLSAKEEERFEIRRRGFLAIGTISDGVRFLFLFCVPLNTLLLLCFWRALRVAKRPATDAGGVGNPNSQMSKAAKFVSRVFSFGLFSLLSAGFLLVAYLLASMLFLRMLRGG